MNKHQITIERTPESVANAISYAELELQDNFLEYRDVFYDSSNIMHFAYEKGYITEEKFEFWKEGFNNNEIGSEETFEVIFGEDLEFEPYCIAYYRRPEGSPNENFADEYNKQYLKALIVYGELICSQDKYYNSFLDELHSEEGNLSGVEIIIK